MQRQLVNVEIRHGDFWAKESDATAMAAMFIDVV
jgi:hypothetical protein